VARVQSSFSGVSTLGELFVRFSSRFNMITQYRFPIIVLAGMSFALMPRGTVAQETHMHTAARIQIPSSIQAEHQAIHGTLIEATRVAGPVGVAAKALADVLHPHFVREEQVALPPLALLAPLARGEMPEGATSVLAMSDTLKAELPTMLEEHKRIRAAVLELGRVARAAGAEKYERLAEDLAQHALTEEEVLYPAAILVGDLIRARHHDGHRCHGPPR
jgi:iron-sulfur cluster repair protein YtfE (RIC family)